MAGLAAGALVGVALLASAKPDKADHADKPDHGDRMPHRAWPGPSGAPSGSASGRGFGAHSSQGDLAEAFRRHRPKPAEAQAQIAELRGTFLARREAHRELVRTEFGRAALTQPDLVAELKKHARRMAFLNRAKLVAATELEEPKRTTTLDRIDKLTAKEQARHDTAIQKLKGEANTNPSALAAGSGAPSAAPAPAGSAP
jgi:hypothetical protein